LISSARTPFFFFQNIHIDYRNICDFEIQFSAGLLTVTTVCQSNEKRLLRWEDPDPLDIVYYRFGSWEFRSEFFVYTGKALVFSFLN